MNRWFVNGLASIAIAAAFVGVAAVLRRVRAPATLSPVLVTAVAVGLVLVACRVPLERFQEVSAPLRWLLGPAIVALGATLHVNRPVLRRAGAALPLAVVVGSATGVASAVGLARFLGLGPLLTAATLTRTVSTPFAILVQSRAGGPVALGAGLAVLTGVFGAILLPSLLSLCGLRGPATVGIATGVAAHLVGADAVGRHDPATGSFAAVALIGAGILVALILPPAWATLVG